MKTWDELSAEEISAKLERSEQDIVAGRVYSQAVMDTMMLERFDCNRKPNKLKAND